MQMLKKIDNPDFFIIKRMSGVLRCDLFLRKIDLLNENDFTHTRALDAFKYEEIPAYDKEHLFKEMLALMQYFTVEPSEIEKVYPHDKNSRFAMIASRDGKRIEIDKELNGLKDQNASSFKAGYRRRPDTFFKQHVVGDYLRIFKGLQRMVELISQVIRYSR